MWTDFEKTFERVGWVRMVKIVKDVGVDWRDRRLILDLYVKQSKKLCKTERRIFRYNSDTAVA